MKRPALKNKQVVVLRMAFRARKALGTFEKRAAGTYARAILFCARALFINLIDVCILFVR